MAKKNKFESLRKNLTTYNIEKTIGFFKDCNLVELDSILHDLKRNQIFNIKTPSEFTQKLEFIKNINNRIDEFESTTEFKLYFEFIESILSAMEVFYNEFEIFYDYLERNNKTNLFLAYVFTFYQQLMQETEPHVNKKIEELTTNQVFDATSTISIPNRDGHISNIDTQIEFVAEFLKVNIMFYKFKSKTDSIQIIPLEETSESLKTNLEELFQKNMYAILESFNSWKNGIELIDLINLFDWGITKSENDEIIYNVKPKYSKMNEYINKEFGLFIYLTLKHSSIFLKHMRPITTFIEHHDIKNLVNQEYLYIKDTFENEYYIDPNIFNEKHKSYTLESYVKFYLLFRVYFAYILDRNKRKPLFIVKWEFIVKLYLQNVTLFNEQFDIQDEIKLQNFLETCLSFYTNNGQDLFNYPFFNFNFLQYAIPNTIISANLPRIFVERFVKIIPEKKLSQKGPMLEKGLLLDEENLQKRNIKIIKNIDLKIKKNTVGEIDILLFDGKRIIIAELKNQSLCNSSKERYNRKKDLKKKAVFQINKAKKFLYDHQEEMSIKLSIDIKNVTEIIPIVITSLDELHNTIIDDTLVISSFFVKMYFENDRFALREFGLNKNEIIEEKYFNSLKIDLEEFIKFVKSNRSIKLLDYFKDKKINTATVFSNGNTKFRRTILAQKPTTE